VADGAGKDPIDLPSPPEAETRPMKQAAIERVACGAESRRWPEQG
jgi:hypothetical protein